MTLPYPRIAVLGAGAWGTALAMTAAAAGRDTMLWAREADVVKTIAERGENTRFLPGVKLAQPLRVTDDLEQAAKEEALLLAVPAQVLGGFARTLAPFVTGKTPLVICAK